MRLLVILAVEVGKTNAMNETAQQYIQRITAHVEGKKPLAAAGDFVSGDRIDAPVRASIACATAIAQMIRLGSFG